MIHYLYVYMFTIYIYIFDDPGQFAPFKLDNRWLLFVVNWVVWHTFIRILCATWRHKAHVDIKSTMDNKVKPRKYDIIFMKLTVANWRGQSSQIK
jgi:hypothetical protein